MRGSCEINSTSKDGDGLDVGGLGKEIDKVELGDAIAGGGEGLEIGGQRLRRAGDIDEHGRGDAGEQSADLRPGAGARRIEDDEVGAVALEDGGAEEVEGRGFDGAAIGKSAGGQSGEGGLRGLDSGDAGEVRGERAGEEADAGVEVPCESARAVGGDEREEFGQEKAVDLEERAAWNPVGPRVAIEGWRFDRVVEAGRAPGGAERGCSARRLRAARGGRRYDAAPSSAGISVRRDSQSAVSSTANLAGNDFAEVRTKRVICRCDSSGVR